MTEFYQNNQILKKSYKESQAIKEYWRKKSWKNEKIASKTYGNDEEHLYFTCSRHGKYRCGTKNLSNLPIHEGNFNLNMALTTEYLFGDKYVYRGDELPLIIKIV